MFLAKLKELRETQARAHNISSTLTNEEEQAEQSISRTLKKEEEQEAESISRTLTTQKNENHYLIQEINKNENNIVNDILEENKNERILDIKNNIIKDEFEVKVEEAKSVVQTYNTIAYEIILTAKNALENKNLKSSNSAKRLAKSIVSGKITESHLKKMYDISKNKKENHIDFKLAGGKATVALFNLLKENIDLSSALKALYKK